jgi:F0F1-type ATP synthase assembly protein I
MDAGRPTAHQQVGRAMEEGWMAGGSFFGSIVSGTLLGYFADRWLDTEPCLLVIGAALGAYSGFMRLLALSKQNDDDSSWAPWRHR